LGDFKDWGDTPSPPPEGKPLWTLQFLNDFALRGFLPIFFQPPESPSFQRRMGNFKKLGDTPKSPASAYGGLHLFEELSAFRTGYLIPL